MKLKLCILSVLITGAAHLLNAQCTMTITPTIVFGTPGSYTIGSSPSSPVQICGNVALYDTSGGTSQRKYYLLPGASLIIKNTFSHFVYMQGNSTLIKIGASGGSTFIYNEAAATLTGTFSPAATSCSVVSFPTVACTGTATSLSENNFSNLISIYPNPVKNQVTINNENSSGFNCTLTNALGQKIKLFGIENGKTTVDLSNLNDGFYFLTISDKNKMISTKRIIISN